MTTSDDSFEATLKRLQDELDAKESTQPEQYPVTPGERVPLRPREGASIRERLTHPLRGDVRKALSEGIAGLGARFVDFLPLPGRREDGFANVVADRAAQLEAQGLGTFEASAQAFREVGGTPWGMKGTMEALAHPGNILPAVSTPLNLAIRGAPAALRAAAPIAQSAEKTVSRLAQTIRPQTPTGAPFKSILPYARYAKQSRLAATGTPSQATGLRTASRLAETTGARAPRATAVIPRTAAPLERLVTPDTPGTGAPIITKLRGWIKEDTFTRREYAKLWSEELSSKLGQAMNAAADPRVPASRRHIVFKSKLKGRLPPIEGSLRAKLTDDEFEALFDTIWRTDKPGFDVSDAATGLDKLLSAGQVPTGRELRLLGEIFGKEFADDVLTLKPKLNKVIDGILQYLGIFKALPASGDHSFILRQGGVLTAGHPIIAVRNIPGAGTRTFNSPKYTEEVATKIRANPDFAIATNQLKDIGRKRALFIGDIGEHGGTLTREETQIRSNWIDKVPAIGHLVKASERNFTSYLNKIRMDVFSQEYGKWVAENARRVARGEDEIPITPQDIDALVDFINKATGRGRAEGWAKPLMTLLNIPFYSPRLYLSQIQLPGTLISTQARQEPHATFQRAVIGNVGIRKEAARSLVAFTASRITFLSLLSLVPGVSVTANPSSADFGKIRIGPQRLDIFSGMGSLIRYPVQIFTRTDTGTNIRSPGNFNNAMGRFMRSKMSPGFALPADLTIYKQKDFMGRPIDLSTPEGVLAQAWSRLAMYGLRDFVEGWNEAGALGAALALTTEVGTGLTIYDDEESVAQEMFGRSYPSLGPTRRPGVRFEKSVRQKIVDRELERRETFPEGILPQGLQPIIQPRRQLPEERTAPIPRRLR